MIATLTGAGTCAVALGLTLSLPGMTTTVADALNNQFSTKWNTEGSGVRAKIVESDQAPGGAAFEVSVRRPSDNPWEKRVTVPLVKDINQGDEVELRIWVRAERPIKSTGTGNLDLQVVRTSPPFDNIFSQNIRPTEDGQYYTVRGVATSNFDADDVVFGANVGYGRQTLQFGPIFVDRISEGSTE